MLQSLGPDKNFVSEVGASEESAAYSARSYSHPYSRNHTLSEKADNELAFIVIPCGVNQVLWGGPIIIAIAPVSDSFEFHVSNSRCGGVLCADVTWGRIQHHKLRLFGTKGDWAVGTLGRDS